MRIIPLNNRYVVKLVIEEKKAGGLIIPNEQPKQSIYEVIQPHGRTLCVPGDRVILMNYKGQEIEIEGEKLVIVHEDDILALV